MLKYLRTFSPEFVVYRLSLIRNWQGCVITFGDSIARFNSTVSYQRFFREISNPPRRLIERHFFNKKDFHNTGTMGSSISRGGKFNPTKNVSDISSTSLSGHPNFSSSDEFSQTEIIEAVVCKESDLKENEMKMYDVGREGAKVLLVKQKGKITALGTKCPHYGAPLAEGLLGNGRIRCQWHGACFNIANGDIEDFPGLDSLPCYEVLIEGSNVIVRGIKKHFMLNKRIKPFILPNPGDRRVFLVVGGGPAGAVCVETLRNEGFQGKIIFILKEKYLPYDRVRLSKTLNVTIDSLILRSEDFYAEREIEVLLSTPLTALTPLSKKATLADGTALSYDKIFIATGSTPATLDLPGSGFKNIFSLRNHMDAEQINKALTKSSRVVILGTSFIGMETACFCVDKVKSVIIIGRREPFIASFGAVIGARIVKLFEEKHIRIIKQGIKRFEGKGNKLTSVVLQDNTELQADICLVGIGVTYNTGFLHKSGMKLENDGSIPVNEYLQTQSPDVYAGGDLAYAPVLGRKACIGHWGLAHYHGYVAAFNMLGKKKPLKSVPFFWTSLFGKNIRYAGLAINYDDVIIEGNLDRLEFIAFYCSGANVLAVATLNKDPLAAKFAEMLHQGDSLKKTDIQAWMSSPN